MAYLLIPTALLNILATFPINLLHDVVTPNIHVPHNLYKLWKTDHAAYR